MRRCSVLFLLLYLLLIIPAGLRAQDAVPKKKEAPAELKKAATNLEKSLIENDDATIARNYELLAQQFADKDEPAKAEEYLSKALRIYTDGQDTAARPRVLRNIARVQELQGKWQAAAKNYKAAAAGATGTAFKTLNVNDYTRLQNRGSSAVQRQYLDANIALLIRLGKKGEVADAYLQQAALGLINKDTTAALGSYRRALPFAKNMPAKAVKLYSSQAKLYVAAGQYNEAVTAVNNLLAIAKSIKDYDTQIVQLQYLATIYFKMDEADNAVNALTESYKTACTNGKTFEARESLMLLMEYYKSVGDDKAGIALYENFINNLDRILLSDHSLTDAKTFKVTEERIRALENEKVYKDELLTRKNTFNYLLLGFMVVLLLLLVFIVKALYSITTKNKEIALQSLRREMNPHFLFNSLNSVNQFIAQNNELEANKYLTSYSNLMRNTMENSNKDFVTLANETENLTKYLELEHLRFKDKFDFKISVDGQLDPDTVWIPNMIIQPHLENAIWHGLRYKEEKGLLKMDVALNEKTILITIDDNGIGVTRSSELKTHNQKAHNSRGLTNTRERITLLNQLYKTKITFSITEKTGPETGTVVQITLPILYKP